ncbi:MAG TPA: SPFH domain-containing protein [Candidatus Saccharimonadales bacterium]|jgi:regulator of protease activity HflC (stomatin/prohibitin superfamily)|nr:SPFH domain-containing protein [Candidatus Saccharimonadales bacterium]
MGITWLVVVVVIIYLANSLKIIKQYEKGVIFRLGKIREGVKEPGLCALIPIIDHLRKVDLRIVTLPVDSQKVITKDNVSIDVAAVAYYQVQDAIKSVVAIANVESAIYQIAQTTVRNIVGQNMLDDVLSQTVKINEAIKAILDKTTEKWGVYVSMVELKDIQLPVSMQSAMSAAAQAEREKRAKIIAAEGEQLSAAALGKAADIISKHPIALQLRNLQVLSEISSDKNSTIIFPAQFMDTVASVKQFMQKESK